MRVSLLYKVIIFFFLPSLAQYNGGSPSSRIMWIEGNVNDLSNARLCVASKMSKGKSLTKGLYISDIAEVRANASSYCFKLSGLKPSDAECLSVIGTERTIDLMVRMNTHLKT